LFFCFFKCNLSNQGFKVILLSIISDFSRTGQNPYENEIYRENEDELINLLIIGKNGLGRELEEKIRV